MPWNRRDFVRLSSALSAAAFTAAGADRLLEAAESARQRSPEGVAIDESYWKRIRGAFRLDPRLINLNNGNSSPSPIPVHDAYKRHLDSSNLLPVHYRNRILEGLGAVREQLAEAVGCDPAELAFTRNATEALHAAQCGLALDPGDEVITTDQDYTLMLWAWHQRAEREGVVIKRVQFPVPTTAGDLVERIERAITPRTKVLHFCHITNTTGQLFPVRDLSRLARARGIFTIVDGAQAVGHIPFALRDLECDAYGTSLHKWLMAPHGTGFLYVRRESIPHIWPLHAEIPSMAGDIRKFEEIGTHPAAAWAAVADALRFHAALGPEHKAARLRYLTLRWARVLEQSPRVRILSNLDAGQTWGLASFELKDLKAQDVVRVLFEKHRMLLAAEVNQGMPGPMFGHQAIRVTPQIFTTTDEIDAFVAAIRGVIKSGVPA